MTRIALVIFDTRLGNTFQVAEAITRGLRQTPGVEATCANQAEVHAEQLEAADLLVIGGPTEYFRASKHIREFFARIGGFALRGKLGFAFDTHSATPLSGHASRLIERDLRHLGVTLLEPRHSALTREVRTDGRSTAHIVLDPAAVAEFEKIGRHLGEEMLAAIAAHPRTDTEGAD